jgi:deoxyribodipyrimidine photo-lyase
MPNHDDEPDALARDAAVRGALAGEDVSFYTSKDHVVFERDEVMTAGARRSRSSPVQERLAEEAPPFYLKAYPVARHAGALAPWPEAALGPATGVPELQDIDFQRTDLHRLRLPSGSAGAQELLADFLDRIDAYDRARDFRPSRAPAT